MDSFGPMESQFLQCSIRTPHVGTLRVSGSYGYVYPYIPTLPTYASSFLLSPRISFLFSLPSCRLCVPFALCLLCLAILVIAVSSLFTRCFIALRFTSLGQHCHHHWRRLRHLPTSSVVSDVRLSTLTIKVCVELFYRSSPSPLKDHGMTGSTDFRGQNVGEAR
ncbi:uncharacterized protein B0T23DRAFT_57111 [Neurospora hispaniola]|uniref:Uncharacterized protein n=1 Tax=Neurospora hispaniola TaxID=588809 RepID=A0AAJ0HY89_9PEZI|nr:hypothetical protein B0T23DRAFT_57111 [Neurospora hispaniola]